MSSAYPRPAPHPPAEYPSTPAGAAPLPVVVVGGGPVGLAGALGLARRGVDVTVLEAGLSASFGSRAICLSRHSLEVLARLGVGDAVQRTALAWTGGRSFAGAGEVLSFRMPHGAADVRPPMVNISQSEVEEVLAGALDGAPTARVRWGSRVTGVRPGADAVELDVETPAGPRVLRASWVVAADGARSRVREALGLPLAGTSYEGRYVIADIHWPTDRPAERLVWFDPPSNPGSTIIMHRQPGDIWRVDYQLAPGEDADVEVGEDRVRARIARHLDWLGSDVPWTLEWRSLYRAHALSLDDYVHGRVLFAGDAAHLVPIFGVRGLNSGIEDAETLAWQLAAVVHGTASPALLRAYATERRSAWQQNVAAAGKSTRIMTPGSPGWTATRDAVLALAATRPRFRELLDPRQSSATHARTSPLTWPASGAAPHPGDPLADRAARVRTAAGPRSSSLDAERGTGFAVVGVGVAAAELAAGVDRLAGELAPEPVRALLVGPPDGPVPGGGIVLEDPDGAVAGAFGAEPGEVVVVRPDGLLLCRLPGPAGLADGAAAVRAGRAPAGTRPVREPDRPAETDLETAWRVLSEGLDRASADGREAFLTRLALLLADTVPAAVLARAVEQAQHDDGRSPRG
ncbi:FAD-dependent monooxygenase [Geodermatophilus sp. CPCC 205506]|uniref:FAD-dependent monooxygenase n=1 Tax=Geodermatophilus sp. CPCC 205506 TaxID=2936596 RepID=UPI003EEB1A23